MTDYELIMKRLEEIRPDFDKGFTSSEREFLDGLHYRLFHKIITLTGCSDCYRDAYILIYNKLKQDGTMPAKTNYTLKPGAIIHTFGDPNYYSHQVSDEIAETYLSEDPTNIRFFCEYPADWKTRIEKKNETTTTEEVKTSRKSRAKKAQTETT